VDIDRRRHFDTHSGAAAVEQFDAADGRTPEIRAPRLDERRPERVTDQTAAACSQATLETANVRA